MMEQILGDIDVAIGPAKMDAQTALDFLESLIEEIDGRIEGLKADLK